MTFGAELLTAQSLKPLATAAASSLKSLVSPAAEATDFARVLSDAADPAELAGRIRERIDAVLSAAGVAPAPPIEIGLDAQGRLEIAGDHPQTAEIEARLTGDRQLLSEIEQLRRASEAPIRIGWPSERLTNAPPTGNTWEMRPGGYPNW